MHLVSQSDQPRESGACEPSCLQSEVKTVLKKCRVFMEVKQDFTYHVKPNKLDVGGENSASFRANPLAGQDHAHRKVLHPWGPADGTELAEPVGSS